MNLTKFHRQQIVARVMNDTPMRHKLAIGDRLQAIVDEDIVKNAPKVIGPLWKDKELGCFLNRSSRQASYMRPTGQCEYAQDVPYVSVLHGYEVSDSAKQKIAEVIDDCLDEIEQRKSAETALAGALAGVRTRKQFLDQFPELAKYAPDEVTADRSVPAIANVMSSLSKLGWAPAPAAAAAGA